MSPSTGRTTRPYSTDFATMPTEPLPWPIEPAPEPVDRDLEPLLSEPFADAWAVSEPAPTPRSEALRGRLMGRLGHSRAASAAMVTARWKRSSLTPLAPGVTARLLYAAPTDRPLRPGEPGRARLIELAPGSRWSGPDGNGHREWLVLRGSVRLGNERLAPRDHHVQPAGAACPALEASDQGACLFLRESSRPATSGDRPQTVRDAEAGWPEYAPGIRRRVLWQREGEAAMLYLARAGAAVPHHAHGHDEECLMVQGELFLDDLLLQEGDYQLAPAGTAHRITETDTGVVIYAHGDLDLQFVG